MKKSEGQDEIEKKNALQNLIEDKDSIQRFKKQDYIHKSGEQDGIILSNAGQNSFEGHAFPKDKDVFNPFKCDMWSLGVTLEKMIGFKAQDYKEDMELKFILSKLKESDWRKRFDAKQLSKFIVERGLSSTLYQPDIFQIDIDIVSALEAELKNEDDPENSI